MRGNNNDPRRRRTLWMVLLTAIGTSLASNMAQFAFNYVTEQAKSEYMQAYVQGLWHRCILNQGPRTRLDQDQLNNAIYAIILQYDGLRPR